MFDFDPDTGELYLYTLIGDSDWDMIDSKLVMESLRGYEGRVTVRANSYGGSVDEAIAIYNALTRHKGGVDVAIDSIAASAMSYIAMAGERVTISANGMIMIHSPWTFTYGNAESLRAEADVLDKYEERLLAAYDRRLNLGRDGVKELLAAETWYTADEALEAGLVDAIEDTVVVPPEMPKGVFRNAPAGLKVEPVQSEGTKMAFAREIARNWLESQRATVLRP